MRRLLPGLYQRGYAPDPGDIPFEQRTLAPLSEKKVKHILHGDRKGGGHLHTATKKGKSHFPPWWAEKDVLEAIEDIQMRGLAKTDIDGSLIFEGYSRGVLLRLRVRNGEIGTIYPLKGDGVEDYFPDGNIAKPLSKFTSSKYPDVYGYRFNK